MSCGCNCDECKGTAIATGSTGATGAQGIPGPQGPPGPQGIQGPQGVQGIQGDPGNDGAAGPAGADGADGVNGDRFSTTSVDSRLMGVSPPDLTFTVDTNLAYVPAQPIIISYDAFNYMDATVVSYNSITGVLVATITAVTGAGTYAAWNISLSGVQGPPGPTGATGPQGLQGIQGVQGIQGIQGIQGDPGAQGPPGPPGPPGTNGVNGTIWQQTAGPPGNTPATGTYSIDTTGNAIYYYNGVSWSVVLLGSGPSTPGAFTSGNGAPSGSAANNTVYLDISTGAIYYYNSATTSWNVVPMGYAVTPWQTPSLLAGWVTGSPAIKYRQQGGCVKFMGRVSKSSPSFTTTAVNLFTLTAGYRPTSTKILPQIVDIYGGIPGIIQIASTGVVTLKFDLIGMNTNEICFDGVFFDLS